ncbi:MAG TPA: hypothetical protein VGE12_17890 [Noviherbaspirillum sp.]
MNMMKTLAIAGALAGTMAAAPSNAASAPAVNAKAIEGGVLSERRVAMKKVSKPATPGSSYFAATIIDAPVEKLCAIIQDYSDYPNYMHNTRQARVVYSAADHALVDMTLRMPFGKVKKYRVKMEPRTSERSCRLFWKLVPSEELKPDETIVDTSGYWQLTPHPASRNKTVVEYFIHADPVRVPLG